MGGGKFERRLSGFGGFTPGGRQTGAISKQTPSADLGPPRREGPGDRKFVHKKKAPRWQKNPRQDEAHARGATGRAYFQGGPKSSPAKNGIFSSVIDSPLKISRRPTPGNLAQPIFSEQEARRYKFSRAALSGKKSKNLAARTALSPNFKMPFLVHGAALFRRAHFHFSQGRVLTWQGGAYDGAPNTGALLPQTNTSTWVDFFPSLTRIPSVAHPGRGRDHQRLSCFRQVRDLTKSAPWTGKMGDESGKEPSATTV